MRLAATHGAPGVHVLVYGRSASDAPDASSIPRQQTREASEAIARHFQLHRGRAIFVRQSRRAIDAGAFHNDVVATSNQGVLLYHEAAYEPEDQAALLDECRADLGEAFAPIRVGEGEIALDEAVVTYLFNGQIVTARDGRMTIV